jgi:hypothetical protein
LEDISSGKVKFNNIFIIIFFLDRSLLEYNFIKFLLIAQENLTHGVVLSCLQQQESMKETVKDDENVEE